MLEVPAMPGVHLDTVTLVFMAWGKLMQCQANASIRTVLRKTHVRHNLIVAL